MPDGDQPAEGGTSAQGTPTAEEKKLYEQKNKHKKILRLLTVMAYLSTVSGTAFMLSLYYIFLWQPKVQFGGKALIQDPPPNSLALFFPEMAPQLSARMASEEKAMKWTENMAPGEPLSPQKRKGGRDISESQVPATPKLTLPVIEEEANGKKREARSTVMETTQQTITIAPTGGNRQRLQTQPLQTSTSPPSTPMHRTNPKPGEHPRHTTPHPHPVEIGVHA